MSGLRHPGLVEAYRLLRRRGITTTSLAQAVHTARSFVSRVLCNYERHGGTWTRVRAELLRLECADVVALLEQVPARERAASTWRRPSRAKRRASAPILFHAAPVPRPEPTLSEVAAKFYNWRNQRSA